MIDVFVDTTDLDGFLANIDMHPLLINCANASLSSIKTRVFENGIDSNGQQIGIYSEGYMKVRTGNYPETRLKSGQNKGNFRKAKTKEGQAGVFTKGKNKGLPRPRYNRTNDTKVVASLTREMENDMKVIIGDEDALIGFSDSHNYDKSQWVEATYKKDIWELDSNENMMIDELVNDFLDELL